MQPDGGTADVARPLGIHITTARFHLDRLVHTGAAVVGFHRSEVGRPRKRYARAGVITRSRSDDGAVQYRMLTEPLVNALRTGAMFSAAQVGRRWALRQAASSAAMQSGAMEGTPDMLQAWGYRPHLRTDAEAGRGSAASVIELRGCPFRAPAQANPDVVCGVHRGLIRGSTQALGAVGARVTLEPFVRPDLCLAQVTQESTTDILAEEASR